MNADQLLEVYEKVSEAPDAIAMLRRFILDLAVRGKLVEQDPADEPASELLKRIAAEKASSGKRQKELPEINAKEMGELPSGWSFVPLIALGHWATGSGFPKNEQGQTEGPHFFLKVSDMNLPGNEKFITTGNNCIDDDAAKRMRAAIHPPGTIIFPKIGGAIATNKRRILTSDAAIDNNCLGITFACEIDVEWAYLLLTSLDFTRYQAGTALPALQQGTLAAIPVSLPPFAEQHRIVARVDELMALCKRLEEARKTREETRDKLTAASLARLTGPETTAEDFPTHAAFALEALPALTTRPDQIKTLRQTILNLAVRGKLVEQDAGEESASALLAQMVKERKATVERRKIRGATPPKAPLAEVDGFDLPTSWELCALGQVTLITDPNPSHRYPDYSGGTVPILSTREFAGDNCWNAETAKLTTQAFWEFQKEICDFAEGDIIFARKGRLGLPRFLPPFEKFTFSHTLFSIKPMKGLDPYYLLWLLRREEAVAWLTNEMNQNTGVPTLGKAKTERLPVPLPPLAEQHRIVATVDALMALCDRLEAALTTTDTTRTRLLEALLNEALEPQAEVLEAAE